MKKAIAITVIIACLFGAAEFLEKWIKIERSPREDSVRQEKCSRAAKAFFDAIVHTKGVSSDYIYHYCGKEDKFFILIRNLAQSKSRGRGTLRTEELYDLLTNEHCGTFICETFVGGHPPSVGWQLFDKNGKLESEWVEAIKPYMEG